MCENTGCENPECGVTEADSRADLLLVDDEAPFRKNVARLLEKRGLAVRMAENGEACLAALGRKLSDVVVLDVRMPGMGGLSVLRHIREQYPDIEVLLLTGNASVQDGVDGIKAGAFDYMLKPVEIEHLMSKIRQAREKICLRKVHRREARFRASVEKKMGETERLASLGILATGVAHEINNPLAVIKQSADLLRRISKRPELAVLRDLPEFENLIQNVEDGAERIRRITHQLLMHVRKNKSTAAPVDLKLLVEDVIATLNSLVTRNEISVVVRMGADVEKVGVDPYKLRQVLVNLLTNALQATAVGGTITVTAGADSETFTLTVEDEGEGIPAENRSRIFEPFFTTKGTGQGTGLGLFVTRRIIEGLGGTITVAGRSGRGSVFSVRLPNGKQVGIGTEHHRPNSGPTV